MKQSIPEQIKEINARTGINLRYDISHHFDEIERSFQIYEDHVGNVPSELIKYVPIATVASMEAYFRSAIAEIIDYGKPYTDNLEKVKDQLKLDIEILREINSQQITLGQFIAHSLSCKNFENIVRHLSNLLDVNFLDNLKKHNSKYGTAISGVGDFHTNPGKIFDDVKALYKIRHIFCHEYATKFSINHEHIWGYYYSTRKFVAQCDDYIWSILEPNSPVTQAEMNEQSESEYGAQQINLSNTINLVIKAIADSEDAYDLELFNEAISAWWKYADILAQFKTSAFKNSSISPTIYYQSYTQILKEKRHSLLKEFQYLLDK